MWQRSADYASAVFIDLSSSKGKMHLKTYLVNMWSVPWIYNQLASETHEMQTCFLHSSTPSALNGTFQRKATLLRSFGFHWNLPEKSEGFCRPAVWRSTWHEFNMSVFLFLLRANNIGAENVACWA